MDVTNPTQQNTVSKESHNSRLPVFRLPPEVLLEIFSILVKEWAISLPDRISLLLSAPENESWTPSYTWVPAVCHVCRYWRAYAVNWPRLWSWILVTDRGLFPAVVKRSGQIPISVLYYFKDGHMDQENRRRIRDTVLPNLHRIKSLHIFSKLPFHQIYHSLPQGNLSVIQDISLLLPKNMVSEWNVSDPQNMLLGSWVDQGHSGLLSLSLSYSTFTALRTASRHSLKHLSIHTLIPSAAMSPFLSVLKQMPLLESLVLHHATPPCPQAFRDVPEPVQVLRLPCLQSLTLTGPGQSLTNFTRHISYPALTSMTISLIGLENPLSRPGFVGESLGRQLLPGLQHISLRAVDDGFHLYGWQSYHSDPPLDLMAGTLSAPCTIRVLYKGDDERTQTLLAFNGVVTRAITEDLRTMHLALDHPSNSRFLLWEANLHNVTSVKAVNMTSLYVASIHHLKRILAPQRFEYAGETSCPGLRYLRIESLGRKDVAQLQKILRDYKKVYGMVLNTLSVPACGHPFKALGKLVHNLEIRE